MAILGAALQVFLPIGDGVIYAKHLIGREVVTCAPLPKGAALGIIIRRGTVVFTPCCVGHVINAFIGLRATSGCLSLDGGGAADVIFAITFLFLFRKNGTF